MHAFDEKTGTIFFAEIQNNAISCWNSRTTLKPLYNLDVVEQSNKSLIYPNDLNVIFFYFYIKVFNIPKYK